MQMDVEGSVQGSNDEKQGVESDLCTGGSTTGRENPKAIRHESFSLTRPAGNSNAHQCLRAKWFMIYCHKKATSHLKLIKR